MHTPDREYYGEEDPELFEDPYLSDQSQESLHVSDSEDEEEPGPGEVADAHLEWLKTQGEST